MVESRRRGYAEKTSCIWALVSPSDDRLIGTCGYNRWSLEHAWAELAFDLARGQWGTGRMSEAVLEALRWGFEAAGFNRIHAMVMTTNERSIRLLEKSRFSREGLLRSFRIARGTPRDFWIYSVLRTEWSPPSRHGMRTA
jgi:RimJ/RimL family protein N-acetyltransferase